MGADVAKQYLLIKGKPILQHTLERIAALQPGRIILVVAEDDSQWGSIEATAHCGIVTGGKTRSDSVLNGLKKSALSNYPLRQSSIRNDISGSTMFVHNFELLEIQSG